SAEAMKCWTAAFLSSMKATINWMPAPASNMGPNTITEAVSMTDERLTPARPSTSRITPHARNHFQRFVETASLDDGVVCAIAESSRHREQQENVSNNLGRSRSARVRKLC